MDARAGPAVALTIDVEDYFHVEAFSDRVPRHTWDAYESRVEGNTRRVLDLLDRHEVQGTFFVLGWVARKHPGLVGEIARRGHEVGCHSFWHRLAYSMEPDEFRADLREATRAIEDAAQTRLRGYRAPSFSIRRGSLWALQILAEEGYQYDSSIFPVRHDIYGDPSFPRFPVRVSFPGSPVSPSPGSITRRDGIVEFPPTTVRILGRNVAGPGGGYLRLFPLSCALWALRRVRERERKPAAVYFHPWELDPDQPRMAGRLRSRFRHYVGLAGMRDKVDSLLARLPFAPMGRLLDLLPDPDRWSTELMDAP